MAYSYNDYTSDGVTVVYAISFEGDYPGYLHEDHVIVEFDGVPQDIANRSFDTPTQVHLIAAPAGGVNIRFKRVSSITEALVDFEGGAQLSEKNLDRNTTQMLYLAQEADDIGESTSFDVDLAVIAAEAARDKAEDWAEENEDVEVETGQYSAKHHATKADADATIAVLAKDDALVAQDAAELAETNAVAASTNCVYVSQYANNLETAVASIAGNETTLIIDVKPSDLTGALTIPSTLSLDWQQGCELDGAFTLTINGSISAGNYRIFGSALTVVGTNKIVNPLPQWFGVKGDDSTNNTTYINDYFDFILTTSHVAYFPKGTYRFSEKIEVTATQKVLVVKGDGKRNTTFLWLGTATTEGLEITYTSNVWPPKVHSMSFMTASLASGTGLKIIGPGAASTTFIGPEVFDLELIGANTGAHGWATAIEFEDCWYIQFHNISIKGQTGVAPFACTNGLLLTDCVAIYATEFSIWHVTNAVLSTDFNKGEGFSFSEFELVGVTNGIVLNSTNNAGPGTNIGPGHINAYESCIKLIHRYQTAIHDLLLYRTDDAARSWKGISMVDSDGNHVHDNEMHGSTTATTGTMHGIVVDDTNNCNIHDNYSRGFTGSTKTGILVTNVSGTNHIHNNMIDTSVTTSIVDNSSLLTNIYHNNFPTYIESFTANDATPSVGNSLNGQFRTANTSATTITTFDNGYEVQTITIAVNDTNTTFQHNGITMTLQGSVNFVAGNGSFITLRLDSVGGIWREVSRRTA